MIKKIICIISLLTFFSCTQDLGDFTALSTVNVKGLVSQKAPNKTTIETSGQTCLYSVLFIPFGDTSLNFKKATDEAIKNGKIKGLPDGDILENARIRVEYLNFIIGSKKCVIVEGDLVSSVLK